MTQRYVVTATPPTPNGDFHVGHFSGPYLGGDIFARYQRLRGNEVSYVSSADRNQSYVVTTAERLGVDPDGLAHASHRDMIRTLEAGDIRMDAFNAVGPHHVEVVQNFFRRVADNGHVTIKKTQVPYSPKSGRYLFESFLAGHCPTCWAATAGAICETCGHPNSFSTIDLPRSTTDDDALEHHAMDVAYLELEAFRDRIVAFYEQRRGRWRPHLIELVDELLERRLPDYPLTYPSGWGIPSPIAGTEGQVLNVWAEMLPGLIASTDLCAQDAPWRAQSGAKVVQFLGYDNSFFFAVVHLALAMAHGDCRLPDTIVTNEFFELDNYKFSTSKGHLIWARDLLEEVDVSVVRFYLALANPETQKMNFTRAAMDELSAVRLLVPYRTALATMQRAATAAGLMGREIVVSQAEADRLNDMLDRFARFHEARWFSPQRVAEHLSHLLCRIGTGAEEAEARGDPRELRLALLVTWLVLPVVSAPLMPQFSADLCDSLGRDVPKRWCRVDAGDAVTPEIDALRRAAAVLDGGADAGEIHHRTRKAS